MSVKKDVFAPRHHQIAVPNVQVMMLMKSLKSRNFVSEVFAWQWSYYTLTEAGIQYLLNYLHLAPETLPNTHQALTPAAAPAVFSGRTADGARRGGFRGGAREGYRGEGGRDFQGEGREGGRGGFRGGRGRGGRGGFRGERSAAPAATTASA